MEPRGGSSKCHHPCGISARYVGSGSAWTICVTAVRNNYLWLKSKSPTLQRSFRRGRVSSLGKSSNRASWQPRSRRGGHPAAALDFRNRLPLNKEAEGPGRFDFQGPNATAALS